MLFDLQGKRRRVVQATYLTLAVLMGGGLVFFGIGSSSSGGLFDAFSGGGGDDGSEVVQDRIDANEEKVAANPKAEAARKDLVRDYYSLAVGQVPTAPGGTTGTFPPEAREDLQKASTHWNAYLDAEQDKPDASLARLAIQLYDTTALNQPKEAVRAARIITDADTKNPQSYLLLIQYAMLAGDKRTEKLATQKARDLIPANQQKALTKQLKEIKSNVIAAQIQSGDIKLNGAGAPGGGAPGGAAPSGGAPPTSGNGE
jgi:hypothetical protein